MFLEIPLTRSVGDGGGGGGRRIAVEWLSWEVGTEGNRDFLFGFDPQSRLVFIIRHYIIF